MADPALKGYRFHQFTAAGPPHQVDHVHRNIGDGTPVSGAVAHPVGSFSELVGFLRAHLRDLADLAGFDDLLQSAILPQEPHLNEHGEVNAAVRDCLLDALEIRRGNGQRLFRYDVQLASRAFENDFGALAVRTADAGDIELLAIQQVLPFAIQPRVRPVFGACYFVHERWVAILNRYQLDIRQTIQGLENFTNVSLEPNDGHPHLLRQPHDLLIGRPG